MAFLLYRWPSIRTLAGGSKRMTYIMFVIIAWFLLSWWPHDNLHLHNGLNLQGLLFIEYGFHVTLMIAGAVLAFCAAAGTAAHFQSLRLRYTLRCEPADVGGEQLVSPVNLAFPRAF